VETDAAAANAQEDAPKWAVVELMGRVRYGGRVSEDTLLGTAMLRVDVPSPTGDGYVSQLINPASIYRLTFCSEELARAAARGNAHEPLHSWDLSRVGLPYREDDDDDDVPM